MTSETWAAAMARSLHAPSSGFYRAGRGPGTDFRTAATIAPDLLADALTVLLARLPAGTRRSVVEIGAGSGTVLTALSERLPDHFEIVGVEQRPRPEGLSSRVRWEEEPPGSFSGLLFALEWLDTVPADVVENGRLLLVDTCGAERPGPRPSPADEAWLERWWPTGRRREIGRRRDAAWLGAVSRLERGVALTVDYGHVRASRPVGGTLTGYQAGRRVPPVPDGDRDVTASVAWDAVLGAVLDAEPHLAGPATVLTDQRTALLDLGVRGDLPARLPERPPGSFAAQLQRASRARQLLDPAGLGGFGWLLHAVRVPPSVLPPAAGPALE